jgi:hypothetical protein
MLRVKSDQGVREKRGESCMSKKANYMYKACGFHHFDGMIEKALVLMAFIYSTIGSLVVVVNIRSVSLL